MNALTLTEAATLTMSSREIAELTGKRHDNVMRDIRSMLAELHGEGGVLSFEDTHRNPQNGQEYPVFRLPKRETLILVSGYNLQMRARIIDRWQELEARQPAAPAIPQTLPEALRLAAEAIEERDRLALAHKASSEALAIAAPKAQALDRIASPTEGAVCLRVAAKLLQMPEKQFLQFASAEGFIFRNHHSRIWQGYAEKAKAGLVELKLTTIERDDGSTKTVEQVLITRAGIARLAERLERRNRCTTTTQKATTPTTAATSTRLSTPPSSSMPT